MSELSNRRERAARIDSILPALAAKAEEADRKAEFPIEHLATFADAGLTGLVVPKEFGGLGGGLRDLVAATFALGTACPSTSLAFFFHNSSASRGLLPLEAIEAGLYAPEHVPEIRAFAERLLMKLGRDRHWMANFASEAAKSSTANISVGTTAEPSTQHGVDGYVLNGTKSFGCSTGVADDYLVTAKLPGGNSVEHLGLFFVDRRKPGVSERTKWDAIGMRGTATHGIVLENAFVPAVDAMAVPGGFARMISVSRGSFVGPQVAGTAVYVGAAYALYNFAIEHLTSTTFADTGQPIGTASFQQQLIGQMRMHLDTALLWLRRQVELETAEPPLLPKPEVVRHWRIAKGTIAENSFAVATNALKACGTGTPRTPGWWRGCCVFCRWVSCRRSLRRRAGSKGHR